MSNLHFELIIYCFQANFVFFWVPINLPTNKEKVFKYIVDAYRNFEKVNIFAIYQVLNLAFIPTRSVDLNILQVCSKYLDLLTKDQVGMLLINSVRETVGLKIVCRVVLFHIRIRILFANINFSALTQKSKDFFLICIQGFKRKSIRFFFSNPKELYV